MDMTYASALIDNDCCESTIMWRYRVTMRFWHPSRDLSGPSCQTLLRVLYLYRTRSYILVVQQTSGVSVKSVSIRPVLRRCSSVLKSVIFFVVISPIWSTRSVSEDRAPPKDWLASLQSLLGKHLVLVRTVD